MSLLNVDTASSSSGETWLPLPIENLKRMDEVRTLLVRGGKMSSEQQFYRSLFNVKSKTSSGATMSQSSDIFVHDIDVDFGQIEASFVHKTSESMLPTGSVLEVESFVEKTEVGEIDEIFLVTLSEAEVKIGKSACDDIAKRISMNGLLLLADHINKTAKCDTKEDINVFIIQMIFAPRLLQSEPKSFSEDETKVVLQLSVAYEDVVIDSIILPIIGNKTMLSSFVANITNPASSQKVLLAFLNNLGSEVLTEKDLNIMESLVKIYKTVEHEDLAVAIAEICARSSVPFDKSVTFGKFLISFIQNLKAPISVRVEEILTHVQHSSFLKKKIQAEINKKLANSEPC